MSSDRPDLDLGALARPTGGNAAIPAPRRRWMWWLFPMVLLLGLGFMFFDTARELFENAVPVNVVRPSQAAAGTRTDGSVIFQAAGWIEPDPYPMSVTALAPGVVHRMLVDEGARVKVGDPMCELVADEAQLAVTAAEAELAQAHAGVRTAEVELQNAKASFEAAIEVTEARDSARARLEGRLADLQRRRATVEATASAVRVADLELATQKFLRQEEAVGPWQVELAEARRDTERAKLATAQAEAARAAADVEEATVLLRRTEKDFELRFAEHLRVGTAEASLLNARAVVKKTEADLADARLRLERMTVRSPADGIVLTRGAQPGSVVGPSASSIAICTLYDPTKLRVRVDVPQGAVAGASAGQKARIRCDVRRGRPYQGTVLRIVEIADIQKVTVEVQVRVDDPDGLLKPDVLCTVAVIGEGSSQDNSSPAVAVRIPAACLAGANAVWVVDGETGRATRRTIRTGPRDGDHVLVLEGLNLTDKVIASNLEKLEDGTLVRVEGKP